jgi:hypothetical protein
MPHTRTGGYARVISDGTLRSARLTIVGSALLSEAGLEMSHAALTVPAGLLAEMPPGCAVMPGCRASPGAAMFAGRR